MCLVTMIAAAQLRGAALQQAAIGYNAGLSGHAVAAGVTWFQWGLLFVPGLWGAVLLASKSSVERLKTLELDKL